MEQEIKDTESSTLSTFQAQRASAIVKDTSHTHLFHIPTLSSILLSIQLSCDHPESREKPNSFSFITEETKVNVCTGQHRLGLLPRTRLISAAVSCKAAAQKKRPQF